MFYYEQDGITEQQMQIVADMRILISLERTSGSSNIRSIGFRKSLKTKWSSPFHC